MTFCKTLCSVVLAICTLGATNSPAQMFTSLLSFNGSDGSEPIGSLIQSLDGNLYGTTAAGGAGGIFYKISSRGIFIELYNFCALQNCADGYRPLAGVIQGTDGNFYGTTYYGSHWRHKDPTTPSPARPDRSAQGARGSFGPDCSTDNVA